MTHKMLDFLMPDPNELLKRNRNLLLIYGIAWVSFGVLGTIALIIFVIFSM